MELSLLLLTVILGVSVIICIDKINSLIDKINLLEDIISYIVKTKNFINGNDIDEFFKNFTDY